MTSAHAPHLDGQEKSVYWVAGFVVLLATLCGLFYYKWGGALRTIGGVQTAGHWTGSAQGLTTGGVLTASLFYLRRIWLALVYGLLIGAAVRAFVSPRRVVALLGACLIGFYRPPCDLIFPNLWTVAAIGIFVLGVWQNRLFRSGLVLEDGDAAKR